ncbi:MAG: hypothetical protein LDL41_01210 [Coleofasciculus sp. S288]|nr:hypothetical protein [Coleofasciculus sp. S288]
MPQTGGGDVGSPQNTISQESHGEIERSELLDRLSSCSAGIFRKVASYLRPPTGTLSSEMSSQAIRAAELLEWAEHPDGCGIEQLYDAYLRATGKRKS